MVAGPRLSRPTPRRRSPDSWAAALIGLVLVCAFIRGGSAEAAAAYSHVSGTCMPLAHLIGRVVRHEGTAVVVTQAALEAACNDDSYYPPKGTVPITVGDLIVLGTPSDDGAQIRRMAAKNRKILDQLIPPADKGKRLSYSNAWGADLSSIFTGYRWTCAAGLAAPYHLIGSLYYDFNSVSARSYCVDFSTILAAYGIQVVDGDREKLTADAVSAFLHSEDRTVIAFTRGVQPASAYSARVLFSIGADPPCALPIAVVVHAQGVPYFVPRDQSSYGLLEKWERIRTLVLLPGDYYIAPVKLFDARVTVPMATFRVAPHSYSYLGELDTSGSCKPNELRIQVRDEFARDVKAAEVTYGDKKLSARLTTNLMKVHGTISNNMPPFSGSR